MKKVPLKALLGNAGNWAKNNSPHIMVAVGLAGMIGAIVTAVKVTPKAKKLIDEATEEKGEKLTPVETVKAAWKCYIIPAGCFASGAACIIGSDIKNAKVNAGLMTSATVAETALRTYQEKVVETLGEQKEKEVRKKARDDISEKQNVPKDQIYILGGEKVNCIDCLGNEFSADPDDIRKAINELNNELNRSDSASLNELYDNIPDADDTIVGNYIGWNRKDGLVDVIFSSSLKKNKPLLVVKYDPLPVYNYDKC